MNTLKQKNTDDSDLEDNEGYFNNGTACLK